jgi:hypothetical protein
MTNWDVPLREAVKQATGGREIIDDIDHDRRKIIVDRDVRNPDLLKAIQRAVDQVTSGYDVVQAA